ncbi:hypothetical protein [Aeromonas jandaei]|uniref:hypothetical protein n=1 Tax=Aeromonas jandaei TaxID=650 RepID=UPI003BA241BF
MLIFFGDKIRSQTKPFLYLFQLVAAKNPVHVAMQQAMETMPQSKSGAMTAITHLTHSDELIESLSL